MTPRVYRTFDAQGRLLYIGSTGNIATRFEAHERTGSQWIPYVALITWEIHPSIPAVRCAETLAIMAEGPRFNKRDNWPFTNAPRVPFEDAEPLAVFLDVPIAALLPAGVAA